MKKSLLLILIAVIISLFSANAQSLLIQGVNTSPKTQPNFYDVQKTFNEDWGKKSYDKKDKEEDKDGEWQQLKRWEWFTEQRVFPSGNFFDPEILVKEYSKYKTEHANKKSIEDRSANWQFIGPHTIPSDGGGAGRINCMAFDPNNPNTLFIGAACGGLWKSTDGGNTWSSNTDLLPALSISEIVINPLNTNVMYIATGDKFGTGWGGNYSAGLMKSINGGATWNTTSLNYTQQQTRILQRVLINPQNPTILIVACDDGIYRSNDAAATWTNVQAGQFFDIEFNSAYPSIIYASGINGFYYSSDSGLTWNLISATLCSGGRSCISVTPANSNVIYLWCNNGDLKKSTDGGNSWSLMTSPSVLVTDLDYYGKIITVSPTDANEVYVGGQIIAKSTDGGSTWNTKSVWYPWNAANYAHADNHSISFLPGGNGSTIFSCNDGGIFKTTNGGNTWFDLSNGLDIKQYYRIGCSALDPNLIFAGAQDNGTDRFNGQIADNVFKGDGMECLVDYTDNNIVYASVYEGSFIKSTDGGNTFPSSCSPSGVTGAWVTPMVMHPTNPQILFGGYQDVYKSLDGGNSWNTISTNIDNGSFLNVVAISPSNPNYIYVASSGHIFRTNNGGTNWNNITQNLPVNNAAITGIAINSVNPDKVWVTFSGYSNGDKVFKTTDGGLTWANISGTLPNIPVNCIVYQNGNNDVLYIGTDFGVFYRNLNMNDWVSFNTGLPNVIIDELEIQYTAGKLRAATYGRGIWESDLNTMTGVNQMNDEQSVSIYPNPASDFLTLSGLHFVSGEKIISEIYNILGEKIIDQPIIKNKIDIRTVKPGVYVVKIATSKGMITKKFIKK